MASKAHVAQSRKRKKHYKHSVEGNESQKKARMDLSYKSPAVHTEFYSRKEQEKEESESSSEEETAYQTLVSSIGRKPKSDSESSKDDERDSTQKVENDSDDERFDEEESSGEEDELDESDIEEEENTMNKKEYNRVGTDPEEDDEEEDEDNEEDDQEKEEVIEADDEKKDFLIKENDPFSVHFEKDIEEEFGENLSKKEVWKRSELKIPHVGKAVLTSPSAKTGKSSKNCKDLREMHVKQNLCEAVADTNRKLCGVEVQQKDGLSKFQHSLMEILNKYQDLNYPERTFENGEEIRLVYCLHALNHVLKTRSRVIIHNTKLKTKAPGADTEDCRDQGLTRPKVLIVLPFRESASRVVNIMTSLLMSSDKNLISNKKRFQEEYGEDTSMEKKGLKPEDYDKTFVGNIDDHFRIGLGVAKKTLKLYTKFYASDIILASPLGLRTVIGTEGDKERDYDFLNSIELLIFDQADIFLMQNWDHIVQVMNHLHLQPQESHGVDFSRVRMWTLNGWSRFYRQTLVFSSLATPELNSLFNKHCHNYAGKISVPKRETGGTISQIVTQLPQVFHRMECTSVSNMAESRFDFFVKKVLPQHKDAIMSQTLIFVPSYFDFVRLRNYFAREEMDFVHISEYSNNKQISRARTSFYHGQAHFMLYTERLHFFKRYKVRGIRHLVFYQLPLYSHFYSEFCNMLQDTRNRTDKEAFTCTVIYSQYDAQRLSGIVGTQRAGHMISASKSVHMFVTGENT